MSNSKRYTVKRITISECELTYPTPDRQEPTAVVRYTRHFEGGYVYRDGQQALEQGRGRSGHTLYCGALQDLATLIRCEIRKAIAREQRFLDEAAGLGALGAAATLDEAGHP